MKLEVKKLGFSYKNKEILKDINFSIQTGEMLSILGENGAGKSTLVKCLIGILKPTKDSVIKYDGINLLEKSIKERAKLISYVPQITNVPEINLTVFDTVLLGRLPYKNGNFSKKDKEITLENIKKFDLEQYIYEYVENLSGGEKQRVLLARAITQEPKILILDEPISNLDLKYQISTMKYLKEITKDENIIVLNIIHDLNFALSYSEKSIFLKNGKVLFCGETKEIINKNNVKEVFLVDIDMISHKNRNILVPLE